MVQFTRIFSLLVAGMLVFAGNLRADDKAAAVTPQATPAANVAPVSTPVAKPAKADSPTVAAMKAAIALAEAGKTDEAIAAYEKIGVLKSTKSEAWRLNNEGLAYLIAPTPQPDKAVPLLEKATTTDDTNYMAWNNLGSAYVQTDSWDKAKDAFQKSIDTAKAADASSAKAEGNLADLQKKMDNLAAVIAKKNAKKGGTKTAASKTPAASTTPVAASTTPAAK